jgi:glycosyltransferase involved in cell wall biosynthesis
MDIDRPKVSIITVVLNDAEGLEKTILSVSSQDYRDIEHIIIDGGSTDIALNVIRRFGNKINYWVSEPDNGPYNAMNKGLAIASGTWVNFMNAGDCFYNSNTVSRVFSSEFRNASLIYGDTIADYGTFKIFRQRHNLSDIWKGMVFFHQSMFVKTHLIKDSVYNLKYRLGADYDLIYKLYQEGCQFYSVPFPIALCDAHGISNRYMVKSALDHFWVIKSYKKLTLRETLYHFGVIAYLSLIELIYRFLPGIWIRRIIKAINRKGYRMMLELETINQ